MIRPVQVTDAPAIAAIYNHYIVNSNISFEEKPVSDDDMAARIQQTTAHFPWLVYRDNDELVGYAYASEWRSRSAYRHSVESTIYLRHDVGGRGIGVALYSELLERLKDLGMHVVVGAIALPNAASVRLHEKMGFKKMGQLQDIGFKNNSWVDVGYWQMLLVS